MDRKKAISPSTVSRNGIEGSGLSCNSIVPCQMALRCKWCSSAAGRARKHVATSSHFRQRSLSTSQSACLTNCTPATQSLIFPSPFVQSRTSVSVDYTSPDLSFVARGGPAARARKGLSPHPRHSRASLPAAPFQRRPKTCRLLGSLH